MNSPDVPSKEEYRFQNCCDRCGHLASYAAVDSNGRTLLFCLHHFTDNSDKLLEAGWTFVDRNELDRVEPVSV